VLTGDDSGRRSDDLLALQNIDNSPLLVMALARQLNGTLEVERGQGAFASSVSQGVVTPAQRRPIVKTCRGFDQGSEGMETIPSLDLRGVRVLLVEDTWQVGAALKRLLEELGATIAGPAPTLAEAERLIAEHSPDIALVDIKLRSDELSYGLIDDLHRRGISVIITSGYAVLPERLEKAAAIVRKPFTTQDLLAAFRKVASRKIVS
jgi:CheY-like chemotaxis protein